MENLAKQRGTTDKTIINRIQEKKQRISKAEGIVQEIDSSVEENVKYKKFFNAKHPRNLKRHENNKPQNNTVRRIQF